jgi:hypothetical protein
MNVGLSYALNQDDIKSGMKDTNNNEVILSGLEFKTFNVDADANY